MRTSLHAVPERTVFALPPAWQQWLCEIIDNRCQLLADTHPDIYRLFVTVCALAGFLVLLLFPCLLLVSLAGIWRATAGSDIGLSWSSVVLWLVTGALAGWAGVHLYRFRPALPAGREIDSATHPALLQKLAELAAQCRTRVPDRVVLSGDFDISLRMTPRYALPLASTMTLMIGRPLLQCLSADQVHCLIARRLGQFSMRYNRLGNWLYRLRDVWPLYADGAGNPPLRCVPLRRMFRACATLYALVSGPAARTDELVADRYALEVFSDADVLDAIVTHAVCRQFLMQRYWTVIGKLLQTGALQPDHMHSGMVTVLRGGLRADTSGAWLAQTLYAEVACTEVLPVLAERIDNLGCSNARCITLPETTAAAVYLEPVA